MTRRFLSLATAAAAATLFASACGSPPTAEEAELDQRGTHPEVLGNATTGPGADHDPSVVAGTAQPQQPGGERPGGPAGDQGSAQGDTTATR